MFMYNKYIIFTIIFLILFFSGNYALRSYFNIKSAYHMAQESIKLQKEREDRINEEMSRIQNEMDKILLMQRENLQEMEREGYLHTDDGSNPEWMREFETKHHTSKKDSRNLSQ